jgi:hypothetical protein
VKLKKTSSLTGLRHEMDLPITQRAYRAWRKEWPQRKTEEAFPNLTDEQLNFLILGATREEMHYIFGIPESEGGKGLGDFPPGKDEWLESLGNRNKD